MRRPFPMLGGLIPMLWLATFLASAIADTQPADSPLVTSSPSNDMEGDWRVECPPDISVCGKTTNVEVVHHYNRTIYVTQNHTKTTVKTLPPHTRVITSISLVTVKNQTEGLCRDTSTIYEAAPLIVTVDVNVTTTREFVPIVNSTTVVTSEVTAAALQQCFINTYPSLATLAAPARTTNIDPSQVAPGDGSASQIVPTGNPSMTPEEVTGTDTEDEIVSEATTYMFEDMYGID